MVKWILHSSIFFEEMCTFKLNKLVIDFEVRKIKMCLAINNIFKLHFRLILACNFHAFTIQIVCQFNAAVKSYVINLILSLTIALFSTYFMTAHIATYTIVQKHCLLAFVFDRFSFEHIVNTPIFNACLLSSCYC